VEGEGQREGGAGEGRPSEARAEDGAGVAVVSQEVLQGEVRPQQVPGRPRSAVAARRSGGLGDKTKAALLCYISLA